MKPGDKVEFIHCKLSRFFGVVHYSPVIKEHIVISCGLVFFKSSIEVVRHLTEKDIFSESLKGNPMIDQLKFESNNTISSMLNDELD